MGFVIIRACASARWKVVRVCQGVCPPGVLYIYPPGTTPGWRPAMRRLRLGGADAHVEALLIAGEVPALVACESSIQGRGGQMGGPRSGRQGVGDGDDFRWGCRAGGRERVGRACAP
eukprot:scaffold9208_cov98-Isochrysis_galbana.AAC.2